MILQQDATLSLFNPGTGSKIPLTTPKQNGAAFYPSSCANGRYVVFTIIGHAGAQTQDIWRMDAGGGRLKQLSEGGSPVCSPDGKWVYYSNGSKLTRVPLEGGTPERLSELPTYTLDVSPDGKLVAVTTLGSLDARGDSETQVALVPVDAPQNSRLLGLQRPIEEYNVRFTHDGKAVVYRFRDKDADNLWLQPLDGSLGKQITNFKSEQIIDFHWSFDGKQFGMIRGHTDSDVVLLQDSKQ